MDLKRVISPFIVIGLFVAFAVVIAIVYLQKGKKDKWITRKMKLGAAILTITSISTGCPPQVMCYDPAPQDWFHFDKIDYDENAIVADLPSDSILTGKVSFPNYKAYSFEIITTDSIPVTTGTVIADDGNYDTQEEYFKIQLDPKIATGSYYLNIKASDSETESFNVSTNNLKIK